MLESSWRQVNFFRPYLHYCLSCVHHCEHHSHIHLLIRRVSSLIWFPYILSHRFITSRVYSANTMTGSLLTCKLTQIWYNTAPESQRSWIQIPYRPEFFRALFSLPLKWCSLLRRSLSYSQLHMFPHWPFELYFLLGEGLVGSRLTALIFLSRFKQPLTFMIESERPSSPSFARRGPLDELCI